MSQQATLAVNEATEFREQWLRDHCQKIFGNRFTEDREILAKLIEDHDLMITVYPNNSLLQTKIETLWQGEIVIGVLETSFVNGKYIMGCD